MGVFSNAIQNLQQFVDFMRQAENVGVDYSGELTGSAGGRGMTEKEAKLALRQLNQAGISRRALAVAIRDMTGLRGNEQGLLEAAVRSVGRAPTDVVDIQSDTSGRLTARGVREFLCASARLGQRGSLVYSREGTAGGRLNYGVEMMHGRPGFNASDAARAVEYLRGAGVSASTIRSAAGGVSGEAKQLLLAAVGAHR